MKYSISIAETTQHKHAKSNVHVVLFLRVVTPVNDLTTFCGWIDRPLARQVEEYCLGIFVKGRELIVVSGYSVFAYETLRSMLMYFKKIFISNALKLVGLCCF